MEKICASCGTVGKPKKQMKGSFIIEVFLWLCFLLPGAIYSVWRLTTVKPRCPQCDSENMLPLDSPMGKKMLIEANKSQD